jgi:hypothetical protein
MPSINKKVFIFSTSGNYREKHHDLIKEKLNETDCKIVGVFTCFGEFRPLGFNLDMNGPLALYLVKINVILMRKIWITPGSLLRVF